MQGGRIYEALINSALADKQLDFEIDKQVF